MKTALIGTTGRVAKALLDQVCFDIVLPDSEYSAPRLEGCDLAIFSNASSFDESVRAARVLAISTFDVYAGQQGADEDDAPVWSKCTVVRLPEMFDAADLPLAVHADSEFQFYDLWRLWHDVKIVLRSGAETVNLATQPVRAREVAEAVFHDRYSHGLKPLIRNDVRTKHGRLFGANGPYIRTREQVLHAIAVSARRQIVPVGATLL